MAAPAAAYAATPSIRPSPAVHANTSSVSAVPTTATTFSMRSSRARAARTCSATASPQDGPRPPGLRTRGAPHPGQSICWRTGTGRTVPHAGLQAKTMPGCQRDERLRRVRFAQVVVALLGTEHHHLAVGLRLALDGAQAPPQVCGLDAE